MNIDLDELTQLLEKLSGNKSKVSWETLNEWDKVCTKQAIKIEQLKARIIELEEELKTRFEAHGGERLWL